MEAQIRKALLMRSTIYRDISGDVLSSLSSLAETFDLDAKGLASKLDRFMTVSRPESTSVTIEDIEAFGKDQATGKAKAVNVFARQSWEDLDVNMEEAVESVNPNRRISPYLSKVATPDEAQPQTATTFVPQGPGKFKERCANGAVHSVLNEHIAAPAAAVEGEDKVPCQVEILGAPVALGARYMVDRLADKAAYLDHRIGTFEREVESACGEGYPHSLATAAQDTTIFVGRVCCDTEDGRLNPQSVLLEGSTGVSNGVRVKVDLSACSDFRLFPGQVVCVKGKNPSGFCVVASEVLPGLPLKAAEDSQGGDLSCIMASGPFTTSEDLLYEPLAALLEYAAIQKPDILLLSGPFVDAEHPQIRSGLLEETFDQIFESRIVAQLREFSVKVDGATRILLLPSTRDVHHDLTFPQGPLAADAADQDLTPLANPCTLKCKDVVMGCSSVDWLMSCTKEEISHASKPVDRLPALASHIVNQRSYFPMFPAPTNVPLNTSQGYGLEIPCTPHVLITPSDLAPFAKIVSLQQPVLKKQEAGEGEPAAATEESMNVVCINPGRLTKGATAGTFVHMWVAGQGDAMAVDSAAASDKVGGVDGRCRVEVKKL